LVLNIPEAEQSYEGDHVLTYRRGQPLSGLREVVGELLPQ
jgi:hypothetical protein